ncbi:hypothetical protein EC968_001108 [Mortierella alpina]|nr:hypothetical protein EC968_001108 [Mortierella alpina]
MNFPSLLSDHEQRAFSDFLNQLAQEDSSNHSNADGSNNAGTADPSLTQQQQQQLQLQLQHHLHLRQLQQQHQQQQQAQNSASGMPRLPAPPSILSPSVSLDPSATQQLALAQQQRDWIQQISANPLLAPGGVINPHAMSQAMLQNPLLMAQANAISQAMVLAQQQQQLQLQMQQQQQQQQHFQQQQHQHSQQLDNHHLMHHHPFAPPSNNNMPPSFHMQQQYPGQQHRLHSSQEPLSPSNEHGTSGIQMQSKEPPSKRKSRAASSGGVPDKKVESSSSRSSSPFSPSTVNGQPTQTDAEAMSTNGSTFISKQESDGENGSVPPPSKKMSRRKGSTAKSLSMDSSSGLVAKSAHRSSRDGYDPLQGNPRRKGRGESISKNGASQPNTGNTPDLDMHKEKTEGMDGNDEESSQMPAAPQQESTLSPTPSQNSSSSQAQPKPGSKKPHHELLTEAEKKANHIASEQKRRQNIRVGFDSLVEIVPTLSDCHRSEAVILQKSVDYIHRLMNQKNELKSRVRDLQAHLGDPLDDMDSGSDMEVEQDDIRASSESDAVEKGSSLWVSLNITEAVFIAIGMAFILVLLARLYRSILPKVRIPSMTGPERHPDLFERTLVNRTRWILLPILICTITGSILNTRRSSPEQRIIGAILHQIGVCLLAVCGAIFLVYAVIYVRRYWNHKRSFRQLLIVTILLEISLIYKVVCAFVDMAVKQTALFFIFSPLMEFIALCLLSVDLQAYFLAHPHADTADRLEEDEDEDKV